MPSVSGIGELVGGAEIGRLFGVGRQRVYQLTSRDDFPEPVERLAMGNVWRTDDVRKWARDHDRVMPGDNPA
ncbi:DNA-binding protein [Amycolatopsis sp. WAC 01376]|nr:DNA-binding protein [Amycolatopsis sp. WAC 01376]